MAIPAVFPQEVADVIEPKFPTIRLRQDKKGLFSLYFHPENGNFTEYREETILVQEFWYTNEDGVRQNFTFTSVPGFFHITGNHLPRDDLYLQKNIPEYPLVTLVEDDLGVYRILFNSEHANKTELFLPGRISGYFAIRESDKVQEYSYLGYKGYFYFEGPPVVPVDEATPEPEGPELVAAKREHFALIEDIKKGRALYDAKFEEFKKSLPDPADVPVVSVQNVPETIEKKTIHRAVFT